MLESLDNVNQTLVEMTGFLEVAVWQHLTDAGVDEVGARGVLLGEFGDIVVRSGTKGSGTESESVVRVGHGIEKPLDVLIACHYARQS